MSVEFDFIKIHEEIQFSSREDLNLKFKENPKLLESALDILKSGIETSITDHSWARKVFSAVSWEDIPKSQASNIDFIKTIIFTSEYFLREGVISPEKNQQVHSALASMHSIVRDHEISLMKNLLSRVETCTDQELDQLVELLVIYIVEDEALKIIMTLRKFNFSPQSQTLATMAELEKYKCLSYIVENKIGFNHLNEIVPKIMPIAVEKSDKTLIDILSHAKASFNIAYKDPSQLGLTTPLLTAISQGSDEIIRYLVSKGADINFAKKGVNSPLLQATLKTVDRVKLILELGGDFRNETVPLFNIMVDCLIGVIDNEIMGLLYDNGKILDLHFNDFDQFLKYFNNTKGLPNNAEASLLVLLMFSNDTKELSILQPLIQALRKLPNNEKQIYLKIFDKFSTLEQYKNFAEEWGKLYRLSGGTAAVTIPALLICNISLQDKLSDKELTDIASILSKKEVGQPAIWNPLIKAILSINFTPPVTKQTLLNLFLSSKPADLITTSSIYLALLSSNALSEFNKATSVDELRANLINVFSVVLGEPAIENFEEKYIQNISSMRIPEALPFWLGNIVQALPEESFDVAAYYFTTILEGQENFSKVRYDLTYNPHLEFIEGQRPGLIQKWAQGTGKLNVAEMINAMNISHEQAEMTAQDYCQHLLIEQAHLPLSDDKTMPLAYLKLYLEGKMGQKETLKILSESLKECQYELKKTKDPAKKVELEKKRSFLKLEHMLINFADPKRKLGYEEHTIKLLNDISTFVTDLYPNEPFQKDLTDFLSTKPEKHSIEYYQKLTIEDTDNAEDLALCGSEVKGSCLSYTGLPRINIALTSYGLNGHHRLLAIKNEDRKIVDRAFLTLKIEDDGQPALYLEGCYPFPAEDELLNNVIIAFAIQRAKDLGLPLYCKDPDPQETDTAKLEVKESLVPFVYDDAVGAGQLWDLPIKHPRGKTLYVP